MIRIALLTEIPAPFRIPLFNALAATDGIELRVLFLADRDPKRPYGAHDDEMRFARRTLPGVELVRGGRWVVLNGGVLSELARLRPDVVIVGGWNQPAFWLALAYARLRRAKLVAWVESTARDERPGNALVERAKRKLIEACAGFLVPGRASREYLEGLGVPPERIVVAPNAVDLGVFRDAVAVARANRPELRERLGLSRCTFLYVGRLDREKGIDLLLEAVTGVAADLVVVGDGALSGELRAVAPPNARFVGWVDRDDLVPWYAAADAFVLPSRSEQWGMVLNEAAAAGLPIVASDAAGAAWDIVEDGVSGARVPAGDVPALAGALRRMTDPALRERAGRQTLELSRRFTPEAWAAAVAALARDLA